MENQFLHDCNRSQCRRRRFKRGTASNILHGSGSHQHEPQEGELCDVTKPLEVTEPNEMESVTSLQKNWIHLKTAPDRGLACSQTRSNAIILDNPVPADCLEKVVRAKTPHQKINLSPRLPTKVILKSAWQVRHEGHAQHGNSTGGNLLQTRRR